MVLTDAELLELLDFGSSAGATGTDPKLKTAKVALIVNNISPTSKLTWADLVEASWTGYARSGTITWGNPILSNVTNLPVLVGDEKTFTVTTQPDPPQTVYGYALVSTVSAVDYLLGYKALSTPITPIDATEILVVPRFGLDDDTVEPAGDVTSY